MTKPCQTMTDPKQPKKTKLEIGKELLEPIVEVLEYETASSKLFTEGVDLKDAAEIKISVPVNLHDRNEAALAREQDRARQRIAYEQDTAAIKVLRQKPLLCKTFKEGIERIIETFDKRRLVCSNIFIPRAMLVDLINDYSKKADPVHQRELILAGYLGTLKNAMVIASAGTLVFEITDDNEIVGVDSTRCKREVVSAFECVDSDKDINGPYGVHFDCTIKFAVIDPEGVVWVKLPKIIGTTERSLK